MSNSERGVKKVEEVNPYLLHMRQHPLEFRARLHLLMQRQEITREELTERLGDSTSELTDILLGKQPVTEDLLPRLCEALETDPIELLPDREVDRLVQSKLSRLPDETVFDLGTHRAKDFYGDQSYINRVLLRQIDLHLLNQESETIPLSSLWLSLNRK